MRPKPGTESHSEAPHVREEVLHDPRHPVHRIAGKLVPYLEKLIETSRPQQVILFGSYAYGNPDQSSDVDLLVIKENSECPLEEMRKIRRAWRPIHAIHGYLSIHLLVESPESHRRRLQQAAGFYDEINEKGLRVA